MIKVPAVVSQEWLFTIFQPIHILSETWWRSGWILFAWESSVPTITFKLGQATARDKVRHCKLSRILDYHDWCSGQSYCWCSHFGWCSYSEPGTANTFSDYASQVFLPYVTKQLQGVRRLDVVWDEYVQARLKAYTRSTRGKGSRRRVESSMCLRTGWSFFAMKTTRGSYFLS